MTSVSTNPTQQRNLADQLSRMSPQTAVEFLLEHAASTGASDLYLDCQRDGVDVSVRRHGINCPVTELPLEEGTRCIAHLEAEAGIKSTDRRHQRSGHWRIDRPGGEPLGLRMHAVPTIHGESLAVRLLDRDPELARLGSLGFVGTQLDEFVAMLHRPGGLLLVTGPTGCGKTTTLYAALHHLNDGRRTIHTVETPVEIPVRGLRQSQVDGNGSVAELMSGVLRHGPDVLMIGDVYDAQTAQAVVNAANGGRLVLASMNAPSAAAAIQRLVHLGVTPFDLSAALLGIVGQRLVRRLSAERRVRVDLSAAPRTFEEIKHVLGPDEGRIVFAAPPGPATDDAYTGLAGVFEILRMTPGIRALLQEGAAVRQLAAKAVDEGMLELRRAALCKVAQGVTSFDEMQRIVPADETDWTAT